MELETYQNIIKPFNYIINTKGKNIRSVIIKYLINFYDLDTKYINQFIKIIDVIHNSSLLIDDIQDNSLKRRGKECAHLKYGIPLTLNCSYLIIFKLLNDINDINIKNEIINTLYELHNGQGQDIYISENIKFIKLDNYLEIIKKKTSSLIVLIPKLIHSLKEIKNYEKVFELFEKFGIFYQIRDDLINLNNEKYWIIKGFCSDLVERKITYPIILAVKNKIKNYEDIIKFYNNKSKDIKSIYNIINKSNIFTEITNQLNDQKIDILNLAKDLNLDDLFNNILTNLSY